MRFVQALNIACIIGLFLLPQAKAKPTDGNLNISQVIVADPNSPTSIRIVDGDRVFNHKKPSVMVGENLHPIVIFCAPTDNEIHAPEPESTCQRFIRASAPIAIEVTFLALEF